MKTCVYSIAKNEIKFVERFMESTKGADCVVITDTGSTDGTPEKLKSLGAIVHNIEVRPWRFDVARNKSLDLIPDDIDWCICLDLDEVLVSGWREKLEKAIHPGITRMKYKFTWNWKASGVPDIQFLSEKIHIRKGYKWKHPVHEVLKWVGEGRETYGISDLEVEHHADVSKVRGSYLPLLELAVQEEPNDDRNVHYLGREYFYYGRYSEAIEMLKRHLVLPNATWDAERAASMRYIAQCYEKIKNNYERLRWLQRAVAECPNTREPWVDLAGCYFDLNDHLGTYYAAKKALNIKDRALNYITNALAWGERPYDLAGISAYYLGLRKESWNLCKIAYDMNPNDPRLEANLRLIARIVLEDKLKQSLKDTAELENKLKDLDKILIKDLTVDL